MPVYNAERYLRASVESVLAQTFGDLELIAINDGSSDGSLDILNAIDDPRLRVETQANAGQCAAQNRGFELARGRYIKFCDQDDLLNPEHIAAQIERMGERDDILVSSRWAYFVDDPSTARFHEEHTHRDYEQPIDWICDSMDRDAAMMGGWMWLIPRALAERAGRWDVRLGLANDFEYSIRLLRHAGGVRYAADAKVFYRKGVEGSQTHSYSHRSLASALLGTELAADNILALEDSTRTRRICADRFQRWLYHVYPQHPELAAQAEAAVAAHGGSELPPQGGALFANLLRFVSWRTIRRMQHLAYRSGWQHILRLKNRKRLRQTSQTRQGARP